MNNETHTVAILGGGFIGKVHAYAYAALPFYTSPMPLRARVKWVVNAHSQTAAETAVMIPGAEGITDWRWAVEDPEVEIVHICTPNHLHFEQLATAISAGKHIYCEKPLTATADEAEKLLPMLENYRGVSHMTFHHRYFASVELAKTLIADGKLGRILEFRGAYMQDSHVDENRPLRWKNEISAGGGALTDIGSHLLDMADWLVGPLRCVSAVSSTPYQKPGDTSRAEDAISMLMRTNGSRDWSEQSERNDRIAAVRDFPLPSGLSEMESDLTILSGRSAPLRVAPVPAAIGTLQVSKIALGHENDLTLEIYGTSGALRINCADPHFLEFCDARPAAVSGPHPVTGWTRLAVGHRYSPPDTPFPATKSSIGWTRAHVACLADFLRAVAEGKDSPLDLRRGVYIQNLMDEVRRQVAADVPAAEK